jgi:predicted Zn finger-like uncharacterized protein
MKGPIDVDHTCPHCGSLYKLTKNHLPGRDKDSIECGICGKTLIEWNGATIFSNERLIRRGERPRGESQAKTDHAPPTVQ